MNDLKVADSEFNDLSSMYKEIGTMAEEEMDKYFQSMNKILNNSIKSGLIYNNLTTFVVEASKIKGVLKEITGQLERECESFVDDIDYNDKYLY